MLGSACLAGSEGVVVVPDWLPELVGGGHAISYQAGWGLITPTLIL